MHKIILFRGGMLGDLILGMIDKNYLHEHGPLDTEDSVCNNQMIKRDRMKMKKFFRYNQQEKIEYFLSLQNEHIEYSLSHDTDFCLSRPDNVIQIVCSDLSKMHLFSQRFISVHRPIVIEEAAKSIGSNKKNFLKDYTESLIIWQNAFIFGNTFDIKDIGTNQFIDKFCSKFKPNDIDWTKKVYYDWLENNKTFM